MVTEFKLPELGEDIQTGDLLKILVSVGDRVTQDQPVMEIETEKALIEVPAPVGGVIKGIHVNEGEQVKIGQLLITIDEDAETAEKEEKAETKPKEGVKEERKEKKTEERKKEAKVELKEEREKEKVSVKEKSEEGVEAEVRKEEEKEKPAEQTVSAEKEQGEVVEFSRPAKTTAKSKSNLEHAPASPSVRRLAREIGVDINEVPGSGPGGRISEEDVKNYARQVLASDTPGTKPSGRQVKRDVESPAEDTSATHMISMVESIAIPRLPDFADWGEIERKPMTSVRRKTAEHVSYGWVSPHVTQHDKADITNLEELRKEYGKKAEEAGGKLTVTAIILKVTASALKVFSQFNASVDMAASEIIYKKYYHIGVAVDTDRGLLVPVIRDVDKKNIIELSVELSEISEKARNKKLTLEEMRGGTFTISNLGGVGGTYFTPIINFPEIAILGVSRSSIEPVFIDGQFEPRLMLPLSLSYDHRVIDGADAARFLLWVAEALAQPFKLILEG